MRIAIYRDILKLFETIPLGSGERKGLTVKSYDVRQAGAARGPRAIFLARVIVRPDQTPNGARRDGEDPGLGGHADDVGPPPRGADGRRRRGLEPAHQERGVQGRRAPPRLVDEARSNG